MDEHSKRSGSETRQRTASVRIRLTPGEREQAEGAAESAGLALGSYVRAKLFTGSQPRAVRSPSVDRKALAQILAQLGRLNGNVNQISRGINFGQGHDDEALAEAVRGIVELRNALLIALGREVA